MNPGINLPSSPFQTPYFLPPKNPTLSQQHPGSYPTEGVNLPSVSYESFSMPTIPDILEKIELKGIPNVVRSFLQIIWGGIHFSDFKIGFESSRNTSNIGSNFHHIIPRRLFEDGSKSEVLKYFPWYLHELVKASPFSAGGHFLFNLVALGMDFHREVERFGFNSKCKDIDPIHSPDLTLPEFFRYLIFWKISINKVEILYRIEEIQKEDTSPVNSHIKLLLNELRECIDISGNVFLEPKYRIFAEWLSARLDL